MLFLKLHFPAIVFEYIKISGFGNHPSQSRLLIHNTFSYSSSTFSITVPSVQIRSRL